MCKCTKTKIIQIVYSLVKNKFEEAVLQKIMSNTIVISHNNEEDETSPAFSLTRLYKKENRAQKYQNPLKKQT